MDDIEYLRVVSSLYVRCLMGLLQAKVISLSVRQQQLLLQERNRHQVSGQLRNRIDTILEADGGHSNDQLCKDLQLSYPMVQHWPTHWYTHQAALLSFEQGEGYQVVSDHQLLK